MVGKFLESGGFWGHFNFSPLVGPGRPWQEGYLSRPQPCPLGRREGRSGSTAPAIGGGAVSEKHHFWVQIIVPHIPLFAIVISVVILLDKQTSEKMQ